MYTLTTLSAVSAYLALTSAIPVKTGFSVPQIPKNIDFIIPGPVVMASTFRKFGKTMPADVRAAAATSAGTVPANPEQFDSSYLCPVQIGGQTLNLDFDTGSSDLWVFSSELPAASTNGHGIYNPATSSTSKQLPGYTWNITYGDGSGASGDVYTDTVSVGRSSVTGQAVELAQTISAQFQQDVNNDGLLGLAFDPINTVKPAKQKTFFSNARASLPAPLFTTDLKKGAVGSYDFGFIDSAKYTGTITYVPVDSSQGFWGFTSNGYAVGNGSFRSASVKAIADTGTTLLYLPQSIVTAYYSRVPGAKYDAAQGGYTYACTTALPSITLGIGSYKAKVPGSYINYAPVDASGRTCFGGIQANTGIGITIFGDIFLKSQFVVFENAGAPRLGVAPKSL